VRWHAHLVANVHLAAQPSRGQFDRLLGDLLTGTRTTVPPDCNRRF
jgi:hypothetical protein